MFIKIKSTEMNKSFTQKTFGDKKFDLLTLMFCHKRLFLAHRAIETLLKSDCPDSTLHIFFLDNSKEILNLIAELDFPKKRTLLIIERSDNLKNTEHIQRSNWMNKVLRNINFDYICSIDGDFESHSKWHKKLKVLADHFKDDTSVYLFTAFNNCTGTWRHNTYQISRLLNGDFYGRKKDCGAGHIFFLRDNYLKLINGTKPLQEWAWILDLKRKGKEIITTVPSYAQHIGVFKSSLGHNNNSDLATDFVGDFCVPPQFCGIWLEQSQNNKDWLKHNTQPLVISHNGLITRTRNISLKRVLGHLTVLNNQKEVILSLNEKFYRCRVKMLNGFAVKLSAVNGELELENLSYFEWEYLGYDTVVKSNIVMRNYRNEYYVFAPCIDINQLSYKTSSSQLADWKKQGLCLVSISFDALMDQLTKNLLLSSSSKSLFQAPTNRITIEPLKLVDSIGTYNIISAENQYYIVPQSIGAISPENWPEIKRLEKCLSASSLSKAQAIAHEKTVEPSPEALLDPIEQTNRFNTIKNRIIKISKASKKN